MNKIILFIVLFISCSVYANKASIEYDKFSRIGTISAPTVKSRYEPTLAVIIDFKEDVAYVKLHVVVGERDARVYRKAISLSGHEANIEHTITRKTKWFVNHWSTWYTGNYYLYFHKDSLDKDDSFTIKMYSQDKEIIIDVPKSYVDMVKERTNEVLKQEFFK